MTSDPHTIQNPLRIAEFQKRLLEMRHNTLENIRKITAELQEDPSSASIVTIEDESLHETRFLTECSLLQKEQEFLDAIDAALGRIETGTYGYCEETGELISLERLTACPTATTSVEAQDRKERASASSSSMDQ